MTTYVRYRRSVGFTSFVLCASLWVGCADSSNDVGSTQQADMMSTLDGTVFDRDARSASDARTDAALTDVQMSQDEGLLDAMARDGTVSTDAEADQMVDPECEPEDVLERNGCSSAGCHALPVRANLDLSSLGFEATLLNAVSPTEGCEGRLLIDVDRPEQSLMLQVIGVHPPLGGDIDTCQTVMPPYGDMTEADKACLTDWVVGLAEDAQGTLPPRDPFEPTPIFSALRKVKTLLHGGAPTSAEVARVEADPAAFRELVSEWVETDAFTSKIFDFFTVNLQQRFQSEEFQQFNRLRRRGSYSTNYLRVIQHSFVRTALDIIERNLPFTNVVTTRRWMVTTANLVLLRYGDQTTEDRQSVHVATNDPAEAPTALEAQVVQRQWLIPSLEGSCTFSQSETLDMLFGFILERRCRPWATRNLTISDSPLTDADFNDWRLVELVAAEDAPELSLLQFYDLPSLRQADRVATRVPRVGFFTTSVFLNNWATNVDNQFRVTTNQSVLGALNIGFSASEPTEPVSLVGLDEAHAEPNTACYGCHKQLDPMRLYFSQHYDINYQRPRDPPNEDTPIPLDLEPSFAFRNHTELGGDLYDFAEMLTNHPRFPYAWVQKLCLYANSERCDERDPRFLELATSFRDGGYRFKSLIVDLFSSPLVTGLVETNSSRLSDAIVSITRLNHLCPLLVERTGRETICEVSRVRAVKGLIARDDFARGAVDVTQPALSSAFHFAAVEAVCEAAASAAVGSSQPYFQPADAELIPKLVIRLMGLSPEHERYERSVEILNRHYSELQAAGKNRSSRARGVFILACMSPDVMGVGL